MVEELFIIKDKQRIKLDLNNPSGITLNYKSNIFSDLSKITCSYSYTFNLPMTVNNRNAFENAEDVRHQSPMIRKKIKAEFYQNGIPLFTNANLYLESASKAYKAVMTWDIVNGMQNLIDNDISLNEIPGVSVEVEHGRVDEGTQNELFDNNAMALYPMYNAGIPFFLWNGYVLGMIGSRQHIQSYTEYGTFPVPVVPVYKIIELINEYFGTKFKLGNHIGIGEATNYNPLQEVVEKGVLPLCGTDLNYEQRTRRMAILQGIKFENISRTSNLDEGSLEFKNFITFESISVQKDDFIYRNSFTIVNQSQPVASYENAGVACRYDNISLEFDGCLIAGFREGRIEDAPRLSLYQMQDFLPGGPAYRGPGANGTIRTYRKWVELASIDGEAYGTYSNGATAYKFDFQRSHGAERLSINDAAGPNGSAIIFVFNYTLGDVRTLDKNIEIFVQNSESVTSGHKVDLVSNLPAISCLAFMKSLFYMMGAYPYVDSSGNMVPRYFSEIKDNLSSGKVLDWSSKCVNSSGNSSDVDIKFAQSSSYAQKNYYLMKSDDVNAEINPEELPEDIYESGVGCLEVDNETLSRDQIVIQVPFYPPYIRNNKFPSFETGNAIKAWTLEKNEGDLYRTKYLKKYCKPQPSLGIIKDREYGYTDLEGNYVLEGSRMTMEIWNGFKNMYENSAMAYFQEILKKPFVVTDNLNLNEFDLLDLDYAVPIYLEKYNSYFAIVSITRGSNGICKCEFIKLP